jgi:hypothetical protein
MSTIDDQRRQAAEHGPSAALRAQRRQTMGGGGQIEHLVSRPRPVIRQADDEWQELAARQREFELLALGG